MDAAVVLLGSTTLPATVRPRCPRALVMVKVPLLSATWPVRPTSSGYVGQNEKDINSDRLTLIVWAHYTSFK